jgi:hypothetical protein
MTERLLLASSDDAWMEALELKLTGAGIETLRCYAAADAIRLVGDPKRPLDAIVLGQRMRGGRAAADGAAALAFAREVRTAASSLPILFLAPAPSEDVNIFAAELPPADIILDDTFAADLAAQIRNSLAFLRPQEITDLSKVTTAAVDIQINNGSMKFYVRVGPVALPPHLKEWSGRMRLEKMADLFRVLRLYRSERTGRRELFHPHWREEFEYVGDHLQNELLTGSQSRLLDQCWKIGDHENIHFRFTIRDKDLIHVPFELIRHPAANAFLREVSPIARRMLLDSANEFRQPPKSARDGDERVLFVGANVDGSLAVPGCTFDGSPTAKLGNLTGIDLEWQEIEKAYAGSQRACERLDLLVGKPIDQLEAKLSEGRWDIVHFSGHSKCADDGKNVFLVLPGRAEFAQLQSLPMRSFADYASRAGARVVVLSSCESCSPEAIIQLAQYGMSTVIGFRWEVLDNGAATFTAQLHKLLAEREPIGRAFVRAIKGLIARDAGNPTFASPMLLVQQDGWIDIPRAA